MKTAIKKCLQMISISIVIIITLISYYVGIQMWHGIESCFLGIALWLVSFSFFTFAKAYNGENEKRNLLWENFTSLLHYVSLAFIIPLGALLLIPGFEMFRWTNDGGWLNRVDPSFWIFYSLMLAALVVIIFVIVKAVKKKKVNKK